MPVNIIRKNKLFQPDASRVIARYLNLSDERGMELIKRVLLLSEKKEAGDTDAGVARLFKKAQKHFANI